MLPPTPVCCCAGEDLHKVLWLKSRNSEVWLERRTAYTRSTAVMSMVGYILGLGDRHPSNLMLDRYSGRYREGEWLGGRDCRGGAAPGLQDGVAAAGCIWWSPPVRFETSPTTISALQPTITCLQASCCTSTLVTASRRA